MLFNTIVERSDESRTTSPSLSMPSSRPSPILKAPTSFSDGDRELTSNTTGRPFGREDYYSERRADLGLHSDTLQIPSRSSDDSYGRESQSSNPTLDFSGLIPMYGDRGGPDTDSRNHLIDLSYNNDWPTSNLAQYSTFQYNTKLSPWHPRSDPHLSPHHWSFPLSAGSPEPRQLHGYGPYPPHSPYSSTSSSPSPSFFLTPPPGSETSSVTPPSRRRSTDQGSAKKSCFHCHVTSTPLWRREPSTQRTLCNACGLYLSQRNKLRPQELIDADIDDDAPQIPDEEYTGPKCSHCLTRQTSVWRRSKTGEKLCNACGVFLRLRGKERPLSLRRNKIKPRTKHAKHGR
ncbi:hypothetical protein DFH09DRAFT_1193078 [Mycena vulgaris]|nr:hypothetical protein DFH09DRAFT_1193078 [Mycena vulgaris]